MAQVYPEPAATKDIETVNDYLAAHGQKQILAEERAGILRTAVGGAANILFTPVRAAKNFAFTNENEADFDSF